jgi:uncharacterized protein (DUF1800 family)
MNTHDSWAPFAPSKADPWDLSKVAHLHRRAGFGASWCELQRDLKDGPAKSIDRLLAPPRPTEDEVSALEGLRKGALDSEDVERLKAWWLYRMLFGNDPLTEKMTLFWHGHFATSNAKVKNLDLMAGQNELFRKHALGSFGDLLAGVAGDGAMLIWLDGVVSKKEKPNENFAREFLELFTLGVGQYTEQDIRAAARAFTGWATPGRLMVPFGRRGGARPLRFEAAAHDAGRKTFLKQTGNWSAADIVRITLQQPACATFLCRKLYRFFVSESEPAAGLIEPLAERLRKSKYSVRAVVETILRSRHFYSKEVRRQKVASPVEHSLGLVRMLEVPRANVNLLALVAACGRQGQELFYPPNVKGWDGGKTWLNSTTVLERDNWGNDVVWGNAGLGLEPYDPLAWARKYGVGADKAAAVLTTLLLQGDLGPAATRLVEAAGRDGKPVGLRKAVQMLLHCPTFQLG